MNKFIITGRVCKDIQIFTKADGTQWGLFNIAVKREYKDSEGNTPVDFFVINVNSRLVKTVQKYCQKGTSVLLECKVKNKVKLNENGEKTYSQEILLDRIEFLYSKFDNSTKEINDDIIEPEKLEPIDDDGLPF